MHLLKLFKSKGDIIDFNRLPRVSNFHIKIQQKPNRYPKLPFIQNCPNKTTMPARSFLPQILFPFLNLTLIIIQSSFIIQILEMINSTAEQKGGNVKVVCRFRPTNERQRLLGDHNIQEILDEKTVAIKQHRSDKNHADPLQFAFDRVFHPQSTQEDVFKYAAAPVIDSVIQGFNGTIFAYGQTSSGKTHTMEGQISQQSNPNAGIIPRMIRRVFTAIEQSSEHIEFRIKVSLVELYMEKLRDLLDQTKTDLKIRSDKKKGIFIQDLTETYISSPSQVYQLMEMARDSRAIASTNMNERSSRSHMLFILTISQNDTDDLSAKTGKLYLVDLAGSEKVGKTGAQGKVLDEAKKINASLTALGKVINALTDGKSTHIPYRDSKLTRVLQESLGGNSKTSLIVTCSPHFNNLSQTVSTLRFGVSAKKIKNKPKINKQMTVAQLQGLLQKAQKQISDKNAYIDQLKNHILVDLKQSSVPQFSSERLSFPKSEEVNLATELERQLEIERSMHLVQEEEMSILKKRYEELVNDKEKLERQNQELKTNQKQLPQIQNTISNLPQVPTEHHDLLEKYELEKEKRLRAEEKTTENEKKMNKKLNQLQNNLNQLTHAYYDLLIFQQRHKVDNVFLRQRLQEKDNSILLLKNKIKQLEDHNRELEDQRWYEEEKEPTYQRFTISAEQNAKLDKLIEKSTISNNGKVVKVLRGGIK